MINAETYEDLNRAFIKLAGVISHARYTGDRSGMIPVDAMGDMVVEMANAYLAINELWMSQTLSTHAESISVSDEAINAANSYYLTTEDSEPPDGEPDW